MKPIIFSLGDTPFIEISEDGFVVNDIDKSQEEEGRGMSGNMMVYCVDIFAAFREYQERCAERERLNSQPMPSGLKR